MTNKNNMRGKRGNRSYITIIIVLSTHIPIVLKISVLKELKQIDVLLYGALKK